MAYQNWTHEQLQAINSKSGNILVAAGAGSGKTSVLVERVLRLIGAGGTYGEGCGGACGAGGGGDLGQNHPGAGAPPLLGGELLRGAGAPLRLGGDLSLGGIDADVSIDRLLIVTFTSAAASEMKDRIASALSDELDKVENFYFDFDAKTDTYINSTYNPATTATAANVTDTDAVDSATAAAGDAQPFPSQEGWRASAGVVMPPTATGPTTTASAGGAQPFPSQEGWRASAGVVMPPTATGPTTASAASAGTAPSARAAHLHKQLVLLESASISTIHSFCYNVIKDNINIINGLDSNFRLLDEAEASLLRADALDDVLEARYADDTNSIFRDLVESYGMGRDDRKVAEVVQRTYTFAQSAPWPDEWLERMTGLFDIKTEQDFNNSIWTKYIAGQLEDELESLLAVLHRYGGTVLACIKKDSSRSEAIQKIADLENFLRMCAADARQSVGIRIQWQDMREAALGLGDMACLCPRAARGEDAERKEGREAVKNAVKKFTGEFVNRFFRLDFADILDEFMQSHTLLHELSSIVNAYSERYAVLKRARSVVDYNDLEHFALHILLERDAETGRYIPSEAANVYRERYAEVLVDEYQDINLVQEYIIKAVSSSSVFMVGDVKQSIYRFRQAMPEIFMEKYMTYGDATRKAGGCDHNAASDSPVASTAPTMPTAPPGTKILLYRNFRSNQRILDFVNMVFSSIMSKKAGELDYTEDEWLLSGINNIDGIDSIEGKDGKDGINGKDGIDGKDGEDSILYGVEVHIISKKPPAPSQNDNTAANVETSANTDLNISTEIGANADIKTNAEIGVNVGMGTSADIVTNADIATSAETPSEDNDSPSNAGDDVDADDVSNAELEARFIAREINKIILESQISVGGGAAQTSTSRGAAQTSTCDGEAQTSTGGGVARAISYGDIAVLMRATKDTAPAFRDELIRLGIPAFTESGSTYFEKYEISVMLSLLKIIDNPLQDIPLFTVMLSPIFSFTPEEAVTIRQAAMPNVNNINNDSSEQTGDSDSGNTWHKPLYDCLSDAASFSPRENHITLSETTTKKARSAIESIGEWRKSSVDKPVSALLWELMHETGFYLKICAMPGAEQRRANLLKLFEYARTYEKISYKGIFNFLRFVDRMVEQGDDLDEANLFGQNSDSVRIMSIHKSKGLEFPVVFLAGCGKSFNLRDVSNQMLLHRELGFGPNYIDLERRIIDDTLAKKLIGAAIRNESLSEEMRILYVAMTRAKSKLYLVGTLADVDKYRNNIENQSAPYSGSSSDDANARFSAEFVLNADKFLYWILSSMNMNAGAGFPLYLHPARDFADETAANDFASATEDERIDEPLPLPPPPSGRRGWAEGPGVAPESPLLPPSGRRGWAEGPGVAPESPLQYNDLPKNFFDSLNARLMWEYPYKWLANIPRKVSVTDIVESRTAARLFIEEADNGERIMEHPAITAAISEEITTGNEHEHKREHEHEHEHEHDHEHDHEHEYEREHRQDHEHEHGREHGHERERYDRMLSIPKFLIGERAFTRAQIGTYTHIVLEKADIVRDAAPAALENLISSLIDNKTLLPEQAAAVDRIAIYNFLASVPGQLAARAEKLNRETVFTVKLSLDEYTALTKNMPPSERSGRAEGPGVAPPPSERNQQPGTPQPNMPQPGTPQPGTPQPNTPQPGTPQPNLFVLMQGSIDCWFDTPDGLVLIDYKTGFTAQKDISDEKNSKYRLQIELYALALKKMTGRDVARKFICMLSAGDYIEIN